MSTKAPAQLLLLLNSNMLDIIRDIFFPHDSMLEIKSTYISVDDVQKFCHLRQNMEYSVKVYIFVQ